MPEYQPLPGFIETLSAAAAEERGLPLTMGPQFRAVKRTGYDADAHTVTMALSSEEPVERGYGTEILSHAKGAIRTGRLEQGISLLFNHDMDQHLGVSINYDIAGGTLRTTSRFGSNPLALEKEQDVKDDILRYVSVGYLVYEMEITEDAKTGHRTVLVTDWEPYEGSLVTVPADPKGSGVGRNLGVDQVPIKYTFRTLEAGHQADNENAATTTNASKDATARSSETDDEDDDEEDDEAEGERSLTPAAASDQVAAPAVETQAQPSPTTSAAPQPSTESRNVMADAIVVADPAVENATRVEGLRGLQKQYPTQFSERSLKDAETLGVSVKQVSERIFDAVVREAEKTDVASLSSEFLDGMTDKDLQRYSVAGAYRAAANLQRGGTFTGKQEGGFEREVGQSMQKHAEDAGVRTLGGGITIPGLTALSQARVLRTITSGGQAGTATNFTQVSSDPIELLRYAVALMTLGARYLPGLHGAVQMTKQTGAATSSWLAEGAAVTPTDPLFGFFTMKPNRLSMASSYDRTFLTQSNLAVEPELAMDRREVLSRSLDTAGIGGSGIAPIPKGLLNFTGLAAILSGSTRANDGTYTAGTGNKPMTYVDYNNLEALISTANAAIGPVSILTTPRVKAAGRSTPKLPNVGSDVIWPDAPVGQGGMGTGPLGMPAVATSNPILTGFTSGANTNCHAVIMGAFSQLLIGDWGLSELIADPITGAASNQMNFWEHGYYDINNRHVESFAACTTVQAN